MTSGNGNHKTPKLLSTEDLAELMGEKPGTVRKRRDRGEDLPYGERVAGRWVYCRRDYERWRDAQSARSKA